jgi:UDP-glucose 4-epimerase
VKQVIDTVQQVSGKQVPYEEGPRRAGDPAKLIASSENVRSDWGWEPQYAELETIVQHAWHWHETHPDGYAGASLATPI